MYTETQKFRQPWIWALLVGSLALTLYHRQAVGVGIMAGGLFLFWLLRLETVISPAGIAYRWFPFQSNYRLIKWAQIEQITVRNYAALGEFGGWGIRISPNGTAHTVSGNGGIEIKLKNKRRFLLIGTQQPDQVRKRVEKDYLTNR